MRPLEEHRLGGIRNREQRTKVEFRQKDKGPLRPQVEHRLDGSRNQEHEPEVDSRQNEKPIGVVSEISSKKKTDRGNSSLAPHRLGKDNGDNGSEKIKRSADGEKGVRTGAYKRRHENDTYNWKTAMRRTNNCYWHHSIRQWDLNATTSIR